MKKKPDPVRNMFMHECRYKEWKEAGGKVPPDLDQSRTNTGMNPDHVHDAALDGTLSPRNMKWINSRVNGTIGAAVGHPTAGFDDKKHTKIKAHPNCKCK
jgi:hypothetical protein